MLASLSHNLGGLFRFSGRTSRGLFWPWAILIFLLSCAVTMVGMVRMMTDMFARIARFARDHPELVTEQRGPGSYSMQIEGYHPELMPDMTGIMTVAGVVTLAVALLLAAAIVRRLHDSGKSGWWGLMPVPFIVVGLAGSQLLFSSVDRIARTESFEASDGWLFFGLFVNNLAYLATLVFLIVLLAAKGTPGPNPYGEAPL